MTSGSAAHPVAHLAPPSDVERRAVALARWRKRSRTVHFYRRLLPWLMVAILTFGVGWVAVRAIVAVLNPLQGVTTIHLLHPTFYGRNDRGEAYVLSARDAVRDSATPDRIAMDFPDMKQFTGAPEPQTVTALRGIFHEKSRQLDLYGQVRASDGQGNHFASEVAHADLPKNYVAAQSPASGYGPSGTFSASSYAIYDKGRHVALRGDVRAHLLKNPVATPRGSAPVH